MRVTLVSTAALLASAVLALPGSLDERQAACNSDNCLRAVRASSTRLADCASYFGTTVTPCPATTVTTTTTVTAPKVTVTPAANKRDLEARQASTCPASRTASTTPTYASVCSSAARYSSACSCAGATHGTTTLAATTATVTATRTVTPTVTAGAPCSTFNVQATSGAYAGQYFYAFNGHMELGAGTARAVALTGNAKGEVVDPATGYVWQSLSSNSDVALYPEDHPAFDFKPMTCSIGVVNGSYSGPISCTGQNNERYFQTCTSNRNVVIFDNQINTSSDNCTALDAIAVPAC